MGAAHAGHRYPDLRRAGVERAEPHTAASAAVRARLRAGAARGDRARAVDSGDSCARCARAARYDRDQEATDALTVYLLRSAGPCNLSVMGIRTPLRGDTCGVRQEGEMT